MKDTIVINLLGGPGTGKTTIAAELFSLLKKDGLEVENVPEYAKELVWQENFAPFNDRLYMHANQNHRMLVMNGKLDYMIVDSPLLLTSIYNEYYLKDQYSKSYNEMIDLAVLETMKLYHNRYYYIERNVAYETIGRREDHQEALIIDKMILEYLKNNHIEYQKLSLDEAVEVIYKEIKNESNINK